MILDLLPTFCNPPEWKRYSAPFRQGEFVVATDGKVAVLLPNIEGEFAEPPKGKTNVADYCKGLIDSVQAWSPWPELPSCDCVMGKRTGMCHHCAGDGECHQCPCEREHDCGFCDGTGEETETCDQCKLSLGSKEFYADVYRRVAFLPELEWGDTNGDPLAFRFAGGFGLMMPVGKR